jgi:hypothetical protein
MRSGRLKLLLCCCRSLILSDLLKLDFKTQEIPLKAQVGQVSQHDNQQLRPYRSLRFAAAHLMLAHRFSSSAAMELIPAKYKGGKHSFYLQQQCFWYPYLYARLRNRHLLIGLQ